MHPSNLQMNRFDAVHDTVTIYRSLLHAFSRPGTVLDIAEEAGNNELAAAGGERVALSLAMTLLDAEVSHYIGNSLADIQEAVINLTFSRRAEPGQADYVFLSSQEKDIDAVELLRQAKAGTLLEPESNATLFVQVDEVAEHEREKAPLLLSGPGIPNQSGCRIEGLPRLWMEERNRRNAEYPLGIDVVFFTNRGKIMALPRTTVVKEVPTTWATFR